MSAGSKIHDRMEALTVVALPLGVVAWAGRFLQTEQGLVELRAMLFVCLTAFLIFHMVSNKWPLWTCAWLVAGMTFLAADRIRAASYLQLPCVEWEEAERTVCVEEEWTQSGSQCLAFDVETHKECVTRIWKSE